MKRLPLAAAILGLACLSSSPNSHAQTDPNLEQGLRPYGTYHGGDLDSVSMTNGNLTLHIPVVSYPQRGDKLTLD